MINWACYYYNKVAGKRHWVERSSTVWAQHIDIPFKGRVSCWEGWRRPIWASVIGTLIGGGRITNIAKSCSRTFIERPSSPCLVIIVVNNDGRWFLIGDSWCSISWNGRAQLSSPKSFKIKYNLQTINMIKLVRSKACVNF